MTLQAGDVCLYWQKGLYGWIIRFHTGSKIAHCEIAMGLGMSAASRDGIGVNYYPTRTEDLAYVLRPKVPFDVASARRYVDKMVGTPYGWFDLLNFVGADVDVRGIVCSPFVTEALRAGGVGVFNVRPAQKIMPFEFLDSEMLADVTEAVTV